MDIPLPGADEHYVYHGSHEKFDLVIPKRQKRIGRDGSVIFDDISFHATPYYWIALAYTLTYKTFPLDGKEVRYNMGVDLYEHRPELDIYGTGSLEESLEKLYGDGGYIYIFKKEDFFHTEGLGNLEVIIQKNIEPIKIERVDDPVSELKRAGATFKFIDLSLFENAKYRI